MYHISMIMSYNPAVHLLDDPKAVDEYAAAIIIKQIETKPNSILSLPTGSTPEGIYKLIVAAHQKQGLDCSKLTIFNLDEYWPIKKTHPSSYYFYMRKNLIDHVNVDHKNWHIPNGEAANADKEAAHYEKILSTTPIDMAVVGIGPGTTCHVGFNESGSALESIARYVPLDEQTKSANSKYFSDPQSMPKGAITQGIADILRAKKIILVAKGESKAWGIKRTLKGAISKEAPASFLRYHPAVEVVLDNQAASLLDN